MTFDEQQKQLLDYLDKAYEVKYNRFFNKYTNRQEWGRQIIPFLAKIFSFEHDFCNLVLKYWSETKGLSNVGWDLAWKEQKLKTKFNPMWEANLENLGFTFSKQQVINILLHELEKEIDVSVLIQLKDKVANLDEFIELIKCVGYETSKIFMNSHGDLQKEFISMNYNDINNERQNNPYWQDWIRTRGQDQKT